LKHALALYFALLSDLCFAGSLLYSVALLCALLCALALPGKKYCMQGAFDGGGL